MPSVIDTMILAARELAEIANKAKVRVDAMDGKVSKASVDYSPGKGDTRCRNCTNFESPSSCLKVEGSIDPAYWCEKFHASRADAGSIAQYATNPVTGEVVERISSDGQWDYAVFQRNPETNKWYGVHWSRTKGGADSFARKIRPWDAFVVRTRTTR